MNFITCVCRTTNLNFNEPDLESGQAWTFPEGHTAYII